jgi:hypothetical protein
MEEGRVPKQAVCCRPRGSRDPSRPCSRWPEQAINRILELEEEEKRKRLSKLLASSWNSNALSSARTYFLLPVSRDVFKKIV